MASGSSGNAYRVTDGQSQLLIECGIKYSDLQKALQFRLSKISACLITHEHMDHSRSVKNLLRAGIDCYMSAGTKKALDVEHHRVKVIEPRKQFKIGDWTILPFEVEHDVNEPLGFLAQNSVGERLLFATDTYYIRYRFKNINILAVECNYSSEILEQNVLDGVIPNIVRRRVMKSHFSLENYLEFLKANDLSKLQEIHVLHMSDNNGNEKLFKREIQKVAGVPVYIA